MDLKRFNEIKARMNAQSGKYIDYLKKYLEIEFKYNVALLGSNNPKDDLATLYQIDNELNILFREVKDPFQRFTHKIQEENKEHGVTITDEEKLYPLLLTSEDTKKLRIDGKLPPPKSLHDFAEQTKDQRILMSLMITLTIKIGELMSDINTQNYLLVTQKIQERQVPELVENASPTSPVAPLVTQKIQDRQVPELVENASPTSPVAPLVMPARDPRRRRPMTSQSPRLSFPANNIAQNTHRNVLLHNSELYPSGANPNPPSEKPQHFLPTKRSKRRGGNTHTKLIYKGGGDDTPPLPYGGDLQAAMRAQDTDAIRTIMTARDNASHSRINDISILARKIRELINEAEQQINEDLNLIDKIIPFTAGAKKRYTLKKKRNVSSKKTKSVKYFY